MSGIRLAKRFHTRLPAGGATRQRVTRTPLAVVLALLGVWLTGCDGTSSPEAMQLPTAQGTCMPDDPATADHCGTVLVSITDAEGDLVAYTVAVESVALHTAAGAVVETLPATTRIDFAALADVSELLSVALVPPGVYTGGVVVLDYSDAQILVEAGGDLVAADIVDEHGQPLQRVAVNISLAAGDVLSVSRRQLATLTVDFDLAASHSVDTAVTPPLVTARPFIIAEVQPVLEKPLRVRGALASVDVQAGTYTVRVRPWHQPGGDHGRMVVHTDDDTRFDIEGTLYTGGDGLRALGQLPQGTLTTAAGNLNLATRRFTADRVHAGDSVAGAHTATIYGNVIAREGNVLTVGAALAVRPGHVERVHRRVKVAVGPETRVFVLARPPVLLETDAISVGQRVVAFGSWSAAADGDPGVPHLDATDGRVRLDPTRLRGTVNDVQAGQVNVALRAIDRLGVGLFDFSGTGMVPVLDADPNDYRIDTGTLPLSGVQVDGPIAVIGRVTPFGIAPPDFRARSIITAPAQVAATLGIGWGPNGTTAPFTTVGSAGIALDLTNPNVGLRHHLKVGARLVSLYELAAVPLIVPAQGRTLYGIRIGDRVVLFREFDAFIDALVGYLGEGAGLQSLAAYGGYDGGGNLFVADRIRAHVVRP